MNKADSAEELFRMGYNCSQSVYAAFAEDLGMSVEEAAKRASPFGAGFGKLREVCGAVSGMVLVLGDLCGHRIRSLLLLGKLLLQLLRLLGAALKLASQDGQVGLLGLDVLRQRRRLLPQGVQSQLPLAHLLPQRLRLGVELFLSIRR